MTRWLVITSTLVMLGAMSCVSIQKGDWSIGAFDPEDKVSFDSDSDDFLFSIPRDEPTAEEAGDQATDLADEGTPEGSADETAPEGGSEIAAAGEGGDEALEGTADEGDPSAVADEVTPDGQDDLATELEPPGADVLPGAAPTPVVAPGKAPVVVAGLSGERPTVPTDDDTIASEDATLQLASTQAGDDDVTSSADDGLQGPWSKTHGPSIPVAPPGGAVVMAPLGADVLPGYPLTEPAVGAPGNEEPAGDDWAALEREELLTKLKDSETGPDETPPPSTAATEPGGPVYQDNDNPLATLINNYRISKGLKPIPLSPSLTTVAETHVMDLELSSGLVTDSCNMHSWSDSEVWQGCCYTADHAKASCMWDKPKELTDYQGNGYEIAYWNSGGATAEKALAGWQTSPGHHSAILNLGQWASKDWKAMGAAMYGQYAVVWFGHQPEPQ